MSATPVRTDRPPPLLGEHTGEVLADVLGYDAARIDTLRKAGAI
jgi:crotonobetainyl-CoA:carnitine CoA-transferase CaiB-like acyl-CoA transferase